MVQLGELQGIQSIPWLNTIISYDTLKKAVKQNFLYYFYTIYSIIYLLAPLYIVVFRLPQQIVIYNDGRIPGVLQTRKKVENALILGSGFIYTPTKKMTISLIYNQNLAAFIEKITTNNT